MGRYLSESLLRLTSPLHLHLTQGIRGSTVRKCSEGQPERFLSGCERETLTSTASG